MTFRRAILAIASTAAITLGLVGCTPSEKQAKPDLSFTAFIGDWSDPALVDASAPSISVLAVDGINFLPKGRGVEPVSDASLALLNRARDNDLKAELMVGNFDPEKRDFSEALAWQTLSSKKAIQRVVDDVAAEVEANNWNGVSLDIEYLKERDAKGLAILCEKLREAIGPDKTISIALMLKTTTDKYRAGGYDFERLVPVVDRFILMAYDQHGSWGPQPGPVGSLEWQRSGVEALLGGVPAEQIELGVAGYGYSWAPDKRRALGSQQARRLAGDEAVWHEQSGEWTAQVDGAEMWWSDIRSFRLRASLARELKLGGVALWSLGTAETITVYDLD